MATRKLKLRKSTRSRNSRYLTAGRRRKTVRRRRSSTAGKILPPLDVRTPKTLKEFEKRIKKGPLTIILVYADWCGHCHTMMPHFDAAAKSPSRSIQAVKVNEQMLSDVNSTVNKTINKSAKPLNVEGYPSIILVDNKANKVTELEPIRNTETMTKVMSQAGPLANQAGINTSPQANAVIKNQVKNIVSNKPISVENVENMAELTAKPNNTIKKNTLMTNIGAEEVGLASGVGASPRNIDIGEEELKGSIASQPNKNKGFNLKSIKPNSMGEAGIPKNLPKESIKEAVAPSSLDMFNEPTEQSNVKAPSGNINKEAEEVTSLASPLMPPSTSSDIEEKSISNSLTPEQKVGGGRRRGGSLYSSMAQATYTIAPAAALLATAAMVTRNRHHNTRKARKSIHRRR